jgi:hypothetical protein
VRNLVLRFLSVVIIAGGVSVLGFAPAPPANLPAVACCAGGDQCGECCCTYQNGNCACGPCEVVLESCAG